MAWLLSLPVLILCVGIGLDIDLPGIYMDAVNPDYMVARMLGGDYRTHIWVLPGNMIVGRIPLLSSLYHGTLHAWIGAPLFAMLGSSVFSLRIVHGLFASLILVTALTWVRRSGAKPIVVIFTGIAVALDPCFIFSFRTQSYITMAPMAALLTSLLLLERARTAVDARRLLFASAALYGLSIYGYFIYAFFLPAIVASTLLWPINDSRYAHWQQRIWPLIAGLCFGVGLYVLGYVRIAYVTGGVSGLVDFISSTQASLGAFSSTLGLMDRVGVAIHFFDSVAQNWWNSDQMIGGHEVSAFGSFRTFLFLLSPIALWILAELMARGNRYLRATAGLMISFFVTSLTFGNRLGGHHYVALLVLAYIVLAIGISRVGRVLGSGGSRVGVAVILSLFVLLGGQSVSAQLFLRAKLNETGGVGLFSEAINRYAEELKMTHTSDYVVMPDWGIYFPVAFLTAGKVEIFYEARADFERRALCSGRNIQVVLITGDRALRYREWTQALGWSAPALRSFRQRNGPVVFEVATFIGDRSHAACAVTR